MGASHSFQQEGTLVASDHRTYADYAQAVGQQLQSHLEKLRDHPFEESLLEAVLLYSFTIEGMEAKASNHVQVLKRVGVILVALNDVLRGILAAQQNLCPMALATSARVATELAAKLRFIVTGPDPEKYSDRYWRHQQIEKLLHDQRKPKPRLTKAEVDSILARCPEWIRKKSDGSHRLSDNWTAESQFDSLAKVAKAADMADDDERLYSVTSKYVHGSPLMAHGYREGASIGALGDPKRCKQMASLGALQCMVALRVACEFFGIEWEANYRPWQARFLEVVDDIHTNPP